MHIRNGSVGQNKKNEIMIPIRVGRGKTGDMIDDRSKVCGAMQLNSRDTISICLDNAYAIFNRDVEKKTLHGKLVK